jgi:hypothetical protein
VYTIEIPSEPAVVENTSRLISVRRNLSINNAISNRRSSDLKATISPNSSGIKRCFSSRDLFAIDQEIEMDPLDQDIHDEPTPVYQEYIVPEMKNIQVELLKLQSRVKRHLANGNLQLTSYLSVNQEAKDNSEMPPESSKRFWHSLYSFRPLDIIED